MGLGKNSCSVVKEVCKKLGAGFWEEQFPSWLFSMTPSSALREVIGLNISKFKSV